MKNIQFLKVEDVLFLHDLQISKFGGLNGIRDLSLLESAVLEPQASFGNSYLYKSIFEMAVAYAFGIIKNHPFLDGNKRTGIVSMMAFLNLNDIDLKITLDEFYIIAIGLASSNLNFDFDLVVKFISSRAVRLNF